MTTISHKAQELLPDTSRLQQMHYNASPAEHHRDVYDIVRKSITRDKVTSRRQSFPKALPLQSHYRDLLIARHAVFTVRAVDAVALATGGLGKLFTAGFADVVLAGLTDSVIAG